MGQVDGRTPLQLLGAASHVPVCERSAGKERKSADNCICLVRTGFYYCVFALDFNH